MVAVDPRVRRFQAMEEFADPSTFAMLDEAGIRPGSRCLELGGGGGSVARWMAGRCAPGEVVVTDLETDLLPDDIANVTVLRHDAATDDFPPGSFDLVHGRAVLEHLPSPDDALARITGWLVPGGRVCFDGLILVTPESTAPHAFRRCSEALEAHAATRIGTNPRWALALPNLMARAGIEGIRAACTPGLVGASRPAGRLLGLALDHLRGDLIAHGLATDEEIAAGLRLLDDENFTDTACLLYSVWGTRPVR